MDILVIVPYFDRPKLLRKCLGSLAASQPIIGGDWHLAFHDDGSKEPGEPIAREVLGDLARKARFYRCEDSPHKSCQLGLRINDILIEAKEDVAIVLCDDDMVSPGYLAGLAEVFGEHPEWHYCYTKNILVDEQGQELDESWGKWDWEWAGEDIDPSLRCDISQVAWRISCNQQDGIWFPTWASRNQDTEFFRRMYFRYGACPCTGQKGQMKRIHQNQLAFADGKIDCDAMVRDARKAAEQFASAGVYDLAERLLTQALEVRPDDQGSRELLENIRLQTGQTPPNKASSFSEIS